MQVQVLEAELGVAAMSMQIDREAAELEKRVALNVRSRGEPIVTTRSGRETMVALLERKGGGRVVLVSMGDDNEVSRARLGAQHHRLTTDVM